MAEDLLTLNEVAAQLRLHPESVRRWLREGKIHGRRLGPTRAGWRIPRSEINRILAEAKISGTGVPDGANG